MLDHRFVLENLEEVKKRLSTRKDVVNWERFLELVEQRKESIQAFEGARHRQKELSKDFKSVAKDPEKAQAFRDEMKDLSASVKELENGVQDVEQALTEFMMYIPNIPHPSTPVGQSEADNVVVSTHGEPTKLDFEAAPHWDIGERLGIIDLEAGAKLSGARFVLYRGAGVQLELGLAQFMMDVAAERGYERIYPPFLVNRECMEGTGQLPKFEEDAFQTDDMFLIPTAEVPITNMYREEILEEANLPLKYVAYSSCFRREAGSAGRDTRGITRVHQFQKVELVKFTRPENSYEALEGLTGDAEEILRRLELPYRRMALCSGDIGFSATKCYDLEVWLPGASTYREISSCSCFEDFQARRANIRYRPEPDGAGKKGKPRFVHTLNGSALAVGRTIVALLENFQQADGSVVIPDALRPYLGGLSVISPKGS